MFLIVSDFLDSVCVVTKPILPTRISHTRRPSSIQQCQSCDGRLFRKAAIVFRRCLMTDAIDHAVSSSVGSLRSRPLHPTFLPSSADGKASGSDSGITLWFAASSTFVSMVSPDFTNQRARVQTTGVLLLCLKFALLPSVQLIRSAGQRHRSSRTQRPYLFWR